MASFYIVTLIKFRVGGVFFIPLDGDAEILIAPNLRKYHIRKSRMGPGLLCACAIDGRPEVAECAGPYNIDDSASLILRRIIPGGAAAVS